MIQYNQLKQKQKNKKKMKELFNDFYQILFFSSLVYILWILIIFGMKLYGRFILEDTTVRFTLKKWDRALIVVAMGLFLSYII